MRRGEGACGGGGVSIWSWRSSDEGDDGHVGKLG